MSVHVDIPIRIRVDPRALTERRGELEETLVAATRRALENSREAVFTQPVVSMGLVVHSPEVFWTGDGLGAVSEGGRTGINERLEMLLADLVRDVGIYEQKGAPQIIPELPPESHLEHRFGILLAEAATHREGTRTVEGGGVQGRPPSRPSIEPETAHETTSDDEGATLRRLLQDSFNRCGQRHLFNEGTHIGFAIVVHGLMHWKLWRRGDQAINTFEDFWDFRY